MKSPPYNNNDSTNNLVRAELLLVDPVKRIGIVKTVNAQNIEVQFASGIGISNLPSTYKNIRVLLSMEHDPPLVLHMVKARTSFTGNDQVTWSDSGEQDLLDTLFSEETTYRPYESDRKLNFRMGSKTDEIPGDVILGTPEGNYIAALRGGMNVLKVSDLCQLVQMIADNITRLVSSELEVLTDWGNLKFTNKNDRVCMTLEGSSNHRNKSLLGIHDFRLQIGACDDDNFISMTFLNRKKQPFLITIDPSGNTFVSRPGDVLQRDLGAVVESVGKDYGQFIGGDRHIESSNNEEIYSGTWTVSSAGTMKATAPNVIVNSPDIKLGGSGAILTLVQDPYITAMNTILSSLVAACATPITAPISGVPFSVFAPGFAAAVATITAGIPVLTASHTTVTKAL